MQPAENTVHTESDPRANFEQMLIERYLAQKGCPIVDIETLPDELVKELMTEACQYAALRLTEIESTAHLWAEVEA